MGRKSDLRVRMVSQVGWLDVQYLRDGSRARSSIANRRDRLGRCRLGSERARSPYVPRPQLCPGDVCSHAYATTTTGSANANGEVLRGTAGLPTRGRRLDPGAGDAHHGSLNVLDHLVSPALPATLLASRWCHRVCHLFVVDVLGGRLHEQGARGPHGWLLGAVCRTIPPRVPSG